MGFHQMEIFVIKINIFGFRQNHIAAAAVLADRTGDDYYWEWYDRIWSYSWKHMIDHKYGAWFRILDSNNNKI